LNNFGLTLIRKWAEGKLLESEGKYRNILESIEDGYFEVDLAGNFTFFNSSLCRVLGYPREEMPGMNNRIFMDAENAKKVFQVFNEVYVTGIPRKGFEWETIRKDGARTYIEVSVSLIARPGEKPTGFRGIARDITERKKAEDALRESKELFSLFMRHSPVYTFIKEVTPTESRVLQASDNYEQMIGIPGPKMIGRTMVELFPPEFAAKITADDWAVVSSGNVLQQDEDLNGRNYATIKFPIIQQGKTLLAGYTIDITERKRLEKELRENEERFRSYLEYAPDGVYMSDVKGNFLYGNRKCEEIIGYRREELIGKNFLELIILSENSLNKAAQLLQANIEGKSTGPDEIELISKEGCPIPVEINTSVVQLMGQGIVLAFVRDITDRKQAEGKLLESEGKYRNILESIEDGYFEVDVAGNLTFFNDSVCRMVGNTSAEMMGINYRQYTDKENSRILYQAFNETFRTGEPSKGVGYEIIRKDGAKLYAESSVSLIRNTSGQPIGFRGIMRNITERKHAEKQLQDTLESLRKAVGTTIRVLTSTVETRDPYTAGHQTRSADLARAIGTEMELPQEKIESIRIAGSIHDIGKLSIPAEILSKPTKLSEIEFSLIKEHARKGYEMLKDVESPWPLAEIVYQHHERMDGSGYPRNLKRGEILIEARILAVADVVEAMASHRPYRPGFGIDTALNEIEKNRGIFYDDDVADACLRLFREKGFQLAEA
jgi:PAS domain S-box-containing protein